MTPKPKPSKFDNTYWRYEFAPLVALAMAVADRIKRFRTDPEQRGKAGRRAIDARVSGTGKISSSE